MPDRVLDSIRANGVAIKADLDLYSCQRPCKAYEGVRTRFPETNFVIIRENHEDLYAGIEYEMGSEDAARLREFLATLGAEVREDAGISIKPISVYGTRRIVRSAFEYARRSGRRKVTAGHKANIMKFSDGLFLHTAQEVAQEYSDIEFEERIIDNLCNQLISRPEEYDVIVLPNLYGDIVSDLGAGMIGGLGMAPGANVGDEYAVFEATHGSAPKYKGQNKVNPSALLLSGVMMLRHLDEDDAAGRMESAIAEVIAEGDRVTYDMKPSRDDPTAVGTSEFADAIIERLT
jgi:isocitrate dehydrogenase (NAD+)